MKNVLLAVAILLTALTTGCIFSTPTEDPVIIDHQHRPTPPASPKHGERVSKESLPAELAHWKEAAFYQAPGAVSAVVGDWLYIVASPGLISQDDQDFTISDVVILDKRVEVEAYLVHANRNSTHAPFYPKDYVRIPHPGGQELPVELNIIYDSAAYAYIKQPFKEIEKELLPTPLKGWQKPAQRAGTQSAIFGDYLYVMITGDEQMMQNHRTITNMELQGNILHVEVTYRPWHAEWVDHFAQRGAPSYVRMTFQGDKVPEVKVEYKQEKESNW